MSFKKINIITDIYFYLVLFSGLAYTVFLIVATEKTLPAMLMQVIFFLDAVKFKENIIGLLFSKFFLINTIPGLIVLGLLGRYLRELLRSAEIIKATKSLVEKFANKTGLIFTAGFLDPKIYISKSLFKKHSPEEMRAMVFHEVNHKKRHHPLKIFIINLVTAAMPIPGKEWFVGNFVTLTEVASDAFAESKIKNKMPIVSALLKFENSSLEPGVSYFNSQSERIKILVGQKKETVTAPMALSLTVLVAVLFSAAMLRNSNIFFDCQHLLKCLESLVSRESVSLIMSDHCQNSSH